MESLDSTNERCAQLESNLKDLLQLKINLEFRNTQLHNSVQQLREELDEKSNKLQQTEAALAQASASASTPTAERSSASTSPAPASLAALGGEPAPTAAEHELLMRKYKKVKRMLQELRRQHANAADSSLNRNSSLASERPDSYNAATGDTIRDDPLSVAVSITSHSCDTSRAHSIRVMFDRHDKFYLFII